MKRNIYVSAIYVSPSNTMGGNTKILMELINNLSYYYNFIIFTTETETFKKNIHDFSSITIIDVPYIFKKFSYTGHLGEIDYVYNFYKKHLHDNIQASDYFYSASDFGPDALSIYKLKKEYNFKWIASLYLFIPSPLKNIIKKYKFPLFKYIIYYFYQRYIFSKIQKGFDLCLITNISDKKYFTSQKQSLILPVYGGVNVDQIDVALNGANQTKKYDAIFCSRLHPQKGIEQLLEIWKIVVDTKKDVELGIIGNGEKSFENFLKEKSKKLGIEGNITWLGYVNNEDKYKIYLQSKVLVHSTIYDNNGMVAAEALCSGIPVVMYNLDELKFYQAGCVKVAIGNKKEYARVIIKLLEEKDYYNKISPSQELVARFKELWRWENRANIFKNFLDNYEKNTT